VRPDSGNVGRCGAVYRWPRPRARGRVGPGVGDRL